MLLKNPEQKHRIKSFGYGRENIESGFKLLDKRRTNMLLKLQGKTFGMVIVVLTRHCFMSTLVNKGDETVVSQWIKFVSAR